MADANKGAIYKAISQISKELGPIAKSDRNKEQGFMYRSIDSVYNAIHELMGKYGVFTVPEVLERAEFERVSRKGAPIFATKIRVRYHVFAEDGSFVTAVVDGEGMDFGDKSTTKALSIAHKYLFLQLFCVPTSDNKDPDADSYETSNELEKWQKEAEAARAHAKEQGKLYRTQLFAALKARMDAEMITKEMVLKYTECPDEATFKKLPNEKLLELIIDGNLGYDPITDKKVEPSKE